jgi:hypothetical protein
MDILKALQAEESKFQQQLDTIQAAIKLLGGKSAGKNGRKKRVLSPAGRARIAAAARRRWARVRRAKKAAS